MKIVLSVFRSSLMGLALLLALGAAANAQTRTWVSGVGDDLNPCSRTAPCKTFAGAISKTAAGGVIDVLDNGAFGTVTITKAITIENDGNFAGILSAGTTGVVVNAGASDSVVEFVASVLTLIRSVSASVSSKVCCPTTFRKVV